MITMITEEFLLETMKICVGIGIIFIPAAFVFCAADSKQSILKRIVLAVVAICTFLGQLYFWPGLATYFIALFAVVSILEIVFDRKKAVNYRRD